MKITKEGNLNLFDDSIYVEIEERLLNAGVQTGDVEISLDGFKPIKVHLVGGEPSFYSVGHAVFDYLEVALAMAWEVE